MGGAVAGKVASVATAVANVTPPAVSTVAANVRRHKNGNSQQRETLCVFYLSSPFLFVLFLLLISLPLFLGSTESSGYRADGSSIQPSTTDQTTTNGVSSFLSVSLSSLFADFVFPRSSALAAYGQYARQALSNFASPFGAALSPLASKREL